MAVGALDRRVLEAGRLADEEDPDGVVGFSVGDDCGGGGEEEECKGERGQAAKVEHSRKLPLRGLAAAIRAPE